VSVMKGHTKGRAEVPRGAGPLQPSRKGGDATGIKGNNDQKLAKCQEGGNQ